MAHGHAQPNVPHSSGRTVISIVICSRDDRRFAAVAATYAARMGDECHEIIRIPDARSLCEGYNRGLRVARGDICVFSHDDIEILSDDLGATIRRHLATFDVVGVAGTTRMAGMFWAASGIRHARGLVAHRDEDGYTIDFFGAPAEVNDGIEGLDGVFIAARRDVAERIGFDEATFDGWHGYDTDFTFRCHLAGHRLAVCLAIRLVHFSRGSIDDAWHHYAARFQGKHADRLATDPGEWITVQRRVADRSQILAAYDMNALRALTEAIHAQLEAGGA